MMLTQALATADRSGYTLLPWPTRAPAGVTQKLRRLRSERGEAEAAGSVNAGWPGCDQACLPPDERAGGPLGALHAAQWVQEAQLPLRYAFVVEPPAGGQGEGGPHFCASEVWTDDGSCWEALRAVAALSVALHAELGIETAVRELHTGELRQTEARALAVESVPRAGASPAGPPVELARAACHEAYVARWLGMRLGSKTLGERQKRYVHTVSARICSPGRCALALAAAHPSRSLPLSLLPRAVGCQSGKDGECLGGATASERS